MESGACTSMSIVSCKSLMLISSSEFAGLFGIETWLAAVDRAGGLFCVF